MYDFATAPFRISLYMKKTLFYFLFSVFCKYFIVKYSTGYVCSLEANVFLTSDFGTIRKRSLCKLKAAYRDSCSSTVPHGKS